MAKTKNAPTDDRKTSLVTTEVDHGELSGGAANPSAALFLKEAKGNRETPKSMPIIAIDHKQERFLLPSGELVVEVGGYPIYYFKTRSFYLAPPKPGERGQPPDCWSSNGLTPSPLSARKQSDACLGCSRNQFGTGRDGRSKACGTYIWIFLLAKSYGDPPVAVLRAPASSLKVLEGSSFKPGYFQRCMARNGGVYETVWSTFGLERAGELHCILAPRMGEPVTDEVKVRRIVEIRNSLLEVMESVRGMTPETPEEHD